jgi:hypothetical protein
MKLTEKQIYSIVMYWYCEGLCPDIFQNEEGIDIEDYLEVDCDYEFYDSIKIAPDELQ